MRCPSLPHALLLRAVATVALVLTVLTAAHAGPRISGRITKVVPEKRLVVLQRSDGKILRAVMQADAHIERMGTETKLTQFRVGDYAVIEVFGPLNEDPLDCVGLYDVHTAGRAPAPAGSVDTSIQGGHAIPGGSAAQSPFAHDNPIPGMSGGSQNIPQPNFVPVWNPTQPWEGVTGEAGQTIAPPVFRSPTMQTTAPGHATGDGGGPAHTPTGPATVAPNFPATPTGGTMTAAPSPSGNPFLGQAVGRNNNVSSAPPVPASPVVTTTRQMPQMTPMPTAPAANPTLFYDEGTPGSIANAARPGMDIVSLQGTVTQVVPGQRAFTMQALVQGRAQMVQVRVPQQIGVLSSRTQQMVGLDSIRIGDYVMVTGIQMMPGAVEARRLYVNQ